MRFLADINITQSVITRLKENNHDVLDLKKINLRIPDAKIIKLARDQNRVILTHDKDFEYLFRELSSRVGIILIRLKKQNPDHHFTKLNAVLENQAETTIKTSLVIVAEDNVRIFPFALP